MKGNTPKPPPTNYFSEQERRTPKPWSKGAKTTRIVTDREQTLGVAPELLPPDAAFKGHEVFPQEKAAVHAALLGRLLAERLNTLGPQQRKWV